MKETPPALRRVAASKKAARSHKRMQEARASMDVSRPTPEDINVSVLRGKPLTARQAETRAFIAAFCQEHGFSPTIREIGGHLQVTLRAAYQHVTALERHGAIERVRVGSKVRALKVLPWDQP